MKKFITSALACAAAFGTFAQEKIGDTAKVGDTTYMFVCELKTPEENANFQRNLNIMQRDSQAVEFFKKQLAAETDAVKKADIGVQAHSLQCGGHVMSKQGVYKRKHCIDIVQRRPFISAVKIEFILLL